MPLPTKLTANTSWQVNFETPNHTVTDGWVAKVVFNNHLSKQTITLTSTGGITWQLNAPPTTTKELGEGKTSYLLFAEKATLERDVVERGFFTIEADPFTSTVPQDQRTHNQRTYDNLCLMLEGKSTKDVESFKIGDRELRKIPILELQQLKRDYSWAVYREKQQAKGNSSGMRVEGFRLS